MGLWRRQGEQSVGLRRQVVSGTNGGWQVNAGVQRRYHRQAGAQVRKVMGVGGRPAARCGVTRPLGPANNQDAADAHGREGAAADEANAHRRTTW